MFVDFFIQIRDWSEEFRTPGLMCIWLAQKPVVGLFKPEYVEVSKHLYMKDINLTCGNSNSQFMTLLESKYGLEVVIHFV